jgi:hypothetical protein
MLVGILEGKRPLGKPSHRWEVNIRMDVREMAWTECIWQRIRSNGVLL